MFKDQNNKLSEQSQSDPIKSPHSPRRSRQAFRQSTFVESQGLQLELSFAPSVEEQAASYVFHNYVSEDNEKTSSKGFFDYLPAFYRRSQPGSILADAVTALGLVGIANSTRDSALLNKAVLKYGATARAVSDRLGVVELAKQDDILISVLLLGLFEVSLIFSKGVGHFIADFLRQMHRTHQDQWPPGWNTSKDLCLF
jgi:hypothetical protein